jgi:hypothetical protein
LACTGRQEKIHNVYGNDLQDKTVKWAKIVIYPQKEINLEQFQLFPGNME